MNEEIVENDSTPEEPATPAPTLADLGVRVETVVSKNQLRVGDTLELSVSLSWNAEGVLALVPENAVHAKGIESVALKQTSSRSIHNNLNVSKNEFTYTLVASDTGHLQIPSLSFSIPLPGAPLVVKSEPKEVLVREPLQLLPVFAGIFCALSIIVAFYFRAKRRKKISLEKKLRDAELDEICAEMLLLKKRTKTAETRGWISDLEVTVNRYIRWKFHEENLDKLLQNEEAKAARESEESELVLNWKPLLQIFKEARYGAQSKSAFEHKETWDLAVSLMNLKQIIQDKEV